MSNLSFTNSDGSLAGDGTFKGYVYGAYTSIHSILLSGNTMIMQNGMIP